MNIINFIDYIGAFAFAISGILAAIERRLDLFGALILGLVTAIGGGTLRDLLIGSTPVGWMENSTYFFIVLACMPICYFFSSTIKRWRKSLFIFDTLGIAIVTILGIKKTLAFGLTPTMAVMMGVVTAVFGGIIRDVLSNQVPLIFRKEVYALACLLGGLVYLVLTDLITEPYAIVCSVLVVVTIRILAIRYHWELAFKAR